MLGVAIRIAQRMGIHRESILAKCDAFEAEMRRRLWWSLMLFDNRIAELAGSNALTLEPTWDCKIPLNVNDTDLRLQMKVSPSTRGEPTDAVFAVVRSELGEFIRHAEFHIEFANPALLPVHKRVHNSIDPESGHLAKLEKMLEDRYLKLCDPENPIHFMATWTTRAQLAKYQLMEQNMRLSGSSARRMEADYDAATASALRMLECDTKVMTSPLTKGFAWLNQIYFPFPAYYQIAQDLRRRPTGEQAQQAWDVVSDNWEAWFLIHFSNDSPIFAILPKFILQAWEAYEAVLKTSAQTLTTPRIVSSIRETQARVSEIVQHTDTEVANISTDMGTNEYPMSMSMPLPATFPDHNLPCGLGMQGGYAWMGPQMNSTSSSSPHGPLPAHMNPMIWPAFGGWPGW